MLLPAAVTLALCLAVTHAAAADATAVKAPPALSKGEALFNSRCAACHGIGAKGTPVGPPFLDKIYEPNHHADSAFYRAPEMGCAPINGSSATCLRTQASPRATLPRPSHSFRGLKNRPA